MALKAYYGISLTLPDQLPHSLFDLLVLADASLKDAQFGVSSIQIQSDDSNGNNRVLIGDSLLDTTRYGINLFVHEGQPLRPYPLPARVPLSAMYVMGPDTTGSPTTIIHVEIVP